MGFFGRLFLPLFAVVTAAGVWLLSAYDRDAVFAIGPRTEDVAKAPGLLAPGAGPVPAPPKVEAERPARERFAGNFDRDDPRPRLALIVTGLGLSKAVTRRVIDDTSPVVTLAFTPYAEDLASLIERARKRGHEVLIAAPMEPGDVKARDAGPDALTVSLAEPALRQRLAWMAERLPHSVGLIGALGDRFARDPAAMRPLLGALAERGMIYIDNRLEGVEPAGSGAVAVAQRGVPTATVRFWIDRILSAEAIDRELAAAAEAAERGGSAVAVAQPYPLTLARIDAWMKAFDRKRLAAAPITAVARDGS
ncbi:MAG: divergent polysaccharide deacetylase family protein [Rhodospirillaceae bacterium]|nr:divergent polysaccharide deacetylase family protein [Rhodospirillaceae bacterium]